MRIYIAMSIMLGVSLMGCGGSSDAPPTYPVSGTVTYQGKPIAKGRIGFAPVVHEGDPSGSGPDYGLEIVDGKFEGEVGAGEFIVSVYASWETGEMEPGDAGSPDVPVMESIPEKYNEASEIKTTIKESPNEGLKFDLE